MLVRRTRALVSGHNCRQSGAMASRVLAFLIGVLGLAALRAQYDALPPPLSDAALPWQLWGMAGYFTVLTNLLVTAHMLAVARGWRIGASRSAGLLVSIVMVGIVYHALLARLWAPTGLAWWADQGLHTAMPLATLLWWLVFAPKAVTLRDLPYWLIWPAAYCVYALIRGHLTGFWPYPFLNIDQLGLIAVTLNIAGMMAAFAALGLLVVFYARRSG